MKQKMLLASLLLVFSLLFAACGGGEDVATVTEEEVAPVVEEAAPVVEEAEEVAEPVEETAVEVVEEPVAEENLDDEFQVFLDDMEAYNTIGLDALNEMMVEGDVFLLDVRKTTELEENGWIEGAVNIPLSELANRTQYLPAEDTTIVSYCSGGWRCTIALTALEAMGWDDVKGLKGGSYGGWVEAGYPIAEGDIPELVVLDEFVPETAVVAEVQQMLDNVPDGFGVLKAEDLETELVENPDLILIDVRRAEEVDGKGHIDAENILFIPLEEFIANSDQWPADLDAPIVTYCGSGHRSTIAMSILWANGYTDVRSLKGGYGGWAGPTVGAPEAEVSVVNAGFQIFLDDMEAYNTIGLDALNELLIDGSVYVLDVRKPAELEENGWIEGAVNIPLSELADNIEYLPAQDTTIVSYCSGGWRCTIALAALEGMGWDDVKGLKGGSYGGWVEAGYPIVEGDIPELVALDGFVPETAVVTEMQAMLHNVPDGFGVLKAEDLATELVENPALQLIDVRRTEEVDEKGYIDAENVLFIPLEEFVANADMWPEDLDTPIVTYCGSGHRSTIAMTILWANGYTDVRSLKGGYGGWAGDGYATIGAPEAETADLNAGFQVFLDDMEAYNTIGIDGLNLMLVEETPVYILDVRKPTELEENGWIEDAVNIPLFELASSTEYLPSYDTTIVSYCGSGWRCTIALATLEAMGWENVLGLKGGSYSGWVDAGYPIAAGMPPELVALDEADVPAEMVAAAQELLDSVPDGFGVITADDLFLAQTENEELILIDVRREEELVEKGIIEHDADRWMHIALEDFIASADMWPEDLDAPIMVYCGSGHRSTIAMTMLWANGYTDVHSLKGGFGGWVDTGYPVMEYAAP